VAQITQCPHQQPAMLRPVEFGRGPTVLSTDSAISVGSLLLDYDFLLAVSDLP
jgi:hypothetical protein